MERKIPWEEQNITKMISKESKALILQNLCSASTMERDVNESTERVFLDPQLSIDQSKLQNDFIVNFEMVSGEVHLLEEKGSLIEKINELIQELGAQSVSFWNTKPLKSLEIASETDLATADIGITGADFAIADTGTLVLLSGPEQPRLTSLLPPVHIAILEKENIVLDIHALFAKLGESYEKNYDELCTCISFITGPSRTADIELNLTLGVHGPGRAIVIIV
ncbi:MAG: lactate utilization protein [Candidatus Dadabacteria bacterium]|nr:lactate utilization protein [Candidatus Dadabacteria bacterium]MDE0477086.1 lactate utilization protein [Candidatus Dadabacteria bacterium]